MPEDTASDRGGNTGSGQPPPVPEPEPAPAAEQRDEQPAPAAMPNPPQAPATPPIPPPPQMTAAERVRVAARRRDETDYIFNYWTALGWTILTFGIYGFYVFYQLVRRMRDHNARRLELLDAAATLAWDRAGRQGLQQEMTPSFERAAGHLAELRQMTGDFREPVIWLVLAIVARGITEIVAFVLLDQDLVKHSQAEAGRRSPTARARRRLRPAPALPRAGAGEAAGQLCWPDPGRGLLPRHLHVLVVL
jgi:hypothetical protein